MNSNLPPILSELKQRLTEHYGDRLERLVLFGSHARGDAEPDSDIDVLVVLNDLDESREERERREDMTYDLSLKYNVGIQLARMSSERFHNRNSPLLINVRREGAEI